MTEDEFRTGVTAETTETAPTTDAAPLAAVDAGVSAPIASTEETPVVTSVSESVASPNAEDTSVAVPTGPVPVEGAPVAGEVTPESDAAAGAPAAETIIPHESFIERVVDEVECVLEAGVKEVESLIEEVREAV